MRVVEPLPQSILFCCDHNSVRSPMAEGIMKKFYGMGTYVQSVGVKGEMEIDGFAIAVCKELGVELTSHTARDFAQLKQHGDDLSSFDLIVTLTAASRYEVDRLTRVFHLDIENWSISDPSGRAETREAKLEAYRESRDQIVNQLIARWGPPKE